MTITMLNGDVTKGDVYTLSEHAHMEHGQGEHQHGHIEHERMDHGTRTPTKESVNVGTPNQVISSVSLLSVSRLTCSGRHIK